MGKPIFFISIIALCFACNSSNTNSNTPPVEIPDTCSCDLLEISPTNRSFSYPRSNQQYTGHCTLSYPSGKTREVRPLKNGKIEGSLFEYYENGDEKSEREFVNNRQHGSFRQWNETGRLTFHALYINGRIDTVLIRN